MKHFCVRIYISMTVRLDGNIFGTEDSLEIERWMRVLYEAMKVDMWPH